MSTTEIFHIYNDGMSDIESSFSTKDSLDGYYHKWQEIGATRDQAGRIYITCTDTLYRFKEYTDNVVLIAVVTVEEVRR